MNPAVEFKKILSCFDAVQSFILNIFLNLQSRSLQFELLPTEFGLIFMSDGVFYFVWHLT